MSGIGAPILLILAQLSAAGAPADASAIAEPNAAASETLKERLSDKASDEQRVDNCRVPADRRGTKLRPDCDARGVPATRSTTGADGRLSR